MRALGGRLVVAAGAALLAGLLLAGPAAPQDALPVGPTLNSSPTVFGTATAGRRLTGLGGTWTGSGGIGYRFQWSRCNAAGAACLAIRGATLPTYTLVALDVGKTLSFSVFATDSTGTAAAYASLVGPIAAHRPPLESTVQPLVEGVPVVGRSLSVTSGSWSPMVSTFGYDWERCNANGRVCALIPRATGASYRVVGADVGHALLALVRASNGPTLQDTFSTASPAAAPASARGPIPLVPPAIAGALDDGSQLVASPGRWQGIGPVGFAFQWFRCDLLGHCAGIGGATAVAYRLGSLDGGRAIAVSVRVTDLAGTTVASAGPVGAVAATGASLAVTSLPTVVGSPAVGSPLSVGPASWSTTPTSTTTSWLRCNASGRLCSTLPGANGASYTPTAADRGHRLAVEMVASVGATSLAALSAPSAPVP